MSYTTKAGDSFDSIAFKLFANSNALPLILRANPDKLHFFFFPAGVVLNIPESSTSISLPLPDWRS